MFHNRRQLFAAAARLPQPLKRPLGIAHNLLALDPVNGLRNFPLSQGDIKIMLFFDEPVFFHLPLHDDVIRLNAGAKRAIRPPLP